MSYRLFIYIVATLFLIAGCDNIQKGAVVPRSKEPSGFPEKLSKAALKRIRHQVRYDPSYRGIKYPGGDVPADTGVCTDVIIRSYRALGIDLQKDVHEEMKSHFDVFPSRRIWGLNSPDPNIDHRRVPNLQMMFTRKGESLAVTGRVEDYIPGDMVTWSVEGRPHIGIVVDRKSRKSKRYLIVHNIGRGPVLEDMLFEYPITGHYRYYGSYSGDKKMEAA